MGTMLGNLYAWGGSMMQYATEQINKWVPKVVVAQGTAWSPGPAAGRRGGTARVQLLAGRPARLLCCKLLL